MPIQESIIESLAVKHIQNVGFSTQAKDFTQEERLVPNPHLVISKEIPAEEWQTLTPAQAIALGRVEKHVVKMTADSTTGTSGNEKAFYADAVEDIENPGTGLLSGFLVVPGSSLWIAEIFEDNGSGTAPDYGSPIVLGKGSTWAIDAPTGVLWLESGTTLSPFLKPFWLVGYTFVGKTLDIYDDQNQTFDNLLSNSSFEFWIGSPNVPDGWTKGTGDTAEETGASNVLFGGSSLEVAQTPGPSFFIRQDPSGFASNIGSGWVGMDVTLSVYAKASGGTAQTVKLRIEDGVGSTEELFDITGNFERYDITHRIVTGATRLRVLIAPEGFSAATETINLLVDGAMLTFGAATVPWAPRNANDTYANALGNDLSIGGTLGVVGAISSGGSITGASLSVGSGAIAGGATSVASLDVNSGGITDAGGITGAGAIYGATTIDASGLITGNGLDNSTGGITNTGAISGATTINASGLITGSSLNIGGGDATIDVDGNIVASSLNVSPSGFVRTPVIYFESRYGGFLNYDATSKCIQVFDETLSGELVTIVNAGGLFARVGLHQAYGSAVSGLDTLGGPNSLYVQHNLHVGGKFGLGVNPPKSDFQIKGATSIESISSGSSAAGWFTRNMYHDGSNWRRLLADHDASMIGMNSSGTFHYYANTDGLFAIDSIISLASRFNILRSGQTTVYMPSGGYNATAPLTVNANVASTSLGATIAIHNTSGAQNAFSALSLRLGSDITSPSLGVDFLTLNDGAGGRQYDLTIKQLTNAGIFFVNSSDSIIASLGASGTITIEGNFLGRADDTSNLGSTNQRFANLYMASIIDFDKDSSPEIKHGDKGSGDGSANNFIIRASSALNTAASIYGGDLKLYAGETSSSSGRGGDVRLYCGYSDGGIGGSVRLVPGNGGSSRSGTIYLGSVFSIRDLAIKTEWEWDDDKAVDIKHEDQNSGDAKNMSITCSHATSSVASIDGGAITITGGDSVSSENGRGGDISLYAGSGYNSTPGNEGYGGDIYLSAGSGGIADRQGDINLSANKINMNGTMVGGLRVLTGTTHASNGWSNITLPTGFTSSNCMVLSYEINSIGGVWYVSPYYTVGEAFDKFIIYFNSATTLSIFHNLTPLKNRPYRIALYRIS